MKKINLEAFITVNKQVQQIYDFWRRPENLPLFMQHIKTIKVLNTNKYLWEVFIPGKNIYVEWEAEIAKEAYGRLLYWHSLPDEPMIHSTKITFEDAGSLGTKILITITYEAPKGLAGIKASSLLTPEFNELVKEDMLRFKQYFETNGIAADI